MTTEERFWSHVKKSDGCWVWTAGLRNGYGAFSDNGKTHRAHRFAWSLQYGPIPVGRLVCHRCDNPPCVRPDHLSLGTAKDNSREACERGRAGRNSPAVKHGSANGQSKLTPADVVRIRELYAAGDNFCQLAKQFGVSPWTISAAVKRTQWKHVA